MGKHENGKTCAILAYILVGIIWYFADEKMKKDDFARFHVKQGLFLLIVSIAISIIIMLFTGILSFIPLIGWIFSAFLGLIVYIALFVLWLLGIINAVQGKKKEVPIIGSYAEKILKI